MKNMMLFGGYYNQMNGGSFMEKKRLSYINNKYSAAEEEEI